MSSTPFSRIVGLLRRSPQGAEKPASDTNPGQNVTKLYVTRDSVAAGDDGDAPHGRVFDVPAGASLQACLETVLAARYLASISGGLATWSAASNIPLAVIAQQWPAPRMLFLTSRDLARLDRVDGALRIHFSYHMQLDPEIVHEVVSRLSLRAEP